MGYIYQQGVSCATGTADSANIGTTTAVADAGWLRQYESTPSQWLSTPQGMSSQQFCTPQGGAAVSGYPIIDKMIRLLTNGTFEIDVYKDVFVPSVVVTPINEYFPCRERRDDEMAVLTGTCMAMSDSVYLSYRWESIYKYERYELYRANREQGLHPNPRPGVMSGCVYRINETGLRQDGKLCFGDILSSGYGGR